MFKNIRKCLDEYELTVNNVRFDEITKEENDIIYYFDLHFSQALMTDLCDDSEKVAKIILAAKGLSNEIKIKVE